MSRKEFGSLWRIELRGYKRPEGWPPVLAEYFVLGHLARPPKELAEFPHSLGGGYILSFTCVSEPTRELKPETLAVVRKKRLERRVQAKLPLFADQMIREALEQKPEYYAGVTDEAFRVAKDEAIQAETDLWERLNKQVGRLVVYAQEPEEAKRRSEALMIEMAEVRARFAGKGER